MGLNWQNHEWSKFQSCSYFSPLNNCGNGQWMSNDMKLLFGYSDNGRMQYESNQTAWARSGAESAYYNYSKDYWNEQSDRLGFWGGMWGGIKDFCASREGAQTAVALGTGIIANLFGFSGDLFKAAANKTDNNKANDKKQDEDCTCNH